MQEIVIVATFVVNSLYHYHIITLLIETKFKKIKFVVSGFKNRPYMQFEFMEKTSHKRQQCTDHTSNLIVFSHTQNTH